MAYCRLMIKSEWPPASAHAIISISIAKNMILRYIGSTREGIAMLSLGSLAMIVVQFL